MMINGYYNDREVKMLYSIMVKVMKGERVLELGPVLGGYLCMPSLRGLFMERPPRTYRIASSYMALA
jgi:hypothetical protein